MVLFPEQSFFGIDHAFPGILSQLILSCQQKSTYGTGLNTVAAKNAPGDINLIELGILFILFIFICLDGDALCGTYRRTEAAGYTFLFSIIITQQFMQPVEPGVGGSLFFGIPLGHRFAKDGCTEKIPHGFLQPYEECHNAFYYRTYHARPFAYSTLTICKTAVSRILKSASGNSTFQPKVINWS